MKGCRILLVSVALLALVVGSHSSSPTLQKEVSVSELEGPIVANRADSPVSPALAAHSAPAATPSGAIAMAETQSLVSATTTSGASAAAGSALHRVSQAWITASLAQMEKERYEEEIRRQVEKEDEDWNALEKQQLPEGTTVALELDSSVAGQAAADREFVSMHARSAESQQLQTEDAEHPIKRVNLMRLPNQHPLRAEPRFAETLARADSQFKQQHQQQRVKISQRRGLARSKVRGKHRAKIGEKVKMKVIRKVIIKKVPVPIPVPVRARELDSEESEETEEVEGEEDVGKYARNMRFAERAKAGAATQAETKQRVHGGSGVFSRRGTRRAQVEAEAEAETGTEGLLGVGKKPKAQAVEDCTGCQFIWKQVEMDVGSGRFVEDVQASFEHNCMDAQKSTIFYGVCEDMYDDMYAMTDDYMSNQYDVKAMCKRAKMC